MRAIFESPTPALIERLLIPPFLTNGSISWNRTCCVIAFLAERTAQSRD